MKKNTKTDDTKRKINEDAMMSGNNTDALTNEIESLKKLLADRDYIIEDLVLERDEVCDDRYAQRMRHDEVERKLREELEASTKRIDRIEHCKRMEDKDEIIDSLVAERDEICEKKHAIREELEELKRKLNSVTNEPLKNIDEEVIRNDGREMSIKNTSLKSSADRSTKELILKSKQDDDSTNTKTIRLENDPSSSKSRDSGINIDIDSFTELIDERLDERLDIMMDKKMKKLVRAEEFGWTKSEGEERLQTTHTNKVSTKTESENTMQEKQIDPKARNIIIHGITADKGKEHDGRIIAELFRNIMVPHIPSSIDRLGMKKTDKARPIRLIMQSEKEKSDFMSNLGRLKYGIDEFKKISITDDYTLDERAEIKTWVKKAEARNTKNESDYIWKVRGSPKHEMRLIKIFTRK